MGNQTLCLIGNLVTRKNSHNVLSQRVRQLSRLSDQLKGNILNHPVPLLAEHIYISIHIHDLP